MWSPALRWAIRPWHDGRHAAGEGDATSAPFEGGEALLEHGHRRVGEAGIDVALLFPGKAPGGLGGVVENEAGGGRGPRNVR